MEKVTKKLVVQQKINGPNEVGKLENIYRKKLIIQTSIAQKIYKVYFKEMLTTKAQNRLNLIKLGT